MISYELIITLLNLIYFLFSFSVFLWILNYSIRTVPECKTHIRFRFIPQYKRLISQYGAKYPCVMESVSTRDTSFHNLKGIYNLESYIFIKDESFVIVSTENPDIYVEIPFKSIIYHHSYCSSANSGTTYSYSIELFFMSNNNIENLWFRTLYYNHKLCKRYPDLLCDDQLYDFVCENFPSKEDYERQRKLERNNQSSIIFETSIFHNFTNIDAE